MFRGVQNAAYALPVLCTIKLSDIENMRRWNYMFGVFFLPINNLRPKT